MRALLLALLAFWLPATASAASVDVAIDQSGISFSESTFYTGDSVRVYARIRNIGEVDVTATVFFYRSNELLGKAQVISLRAGGAPEEVFVDFVVPDGSFNIRAVVQGTVPDDENLANNEAMTPLYEAINDSDRDGVIDEDDNCRDEANADQADADSDGVGNMCDNDDDDDSLTDTEEAAQSTDSLDRDTDDDGLADADDAKPTDPARAEASPQSSKPVSTPISPTPSTKTAVAAPTTTEVTTEVPVDDVDDPTVARPTASYGIFTAANAATESGDPAQSFFRLSNPWLLTLVISLAVLLAGGIVALVIVRHNHKRQQQDDV